MKKYLKLVAVAVLVSAFGCMTGYGRIISLKSGSLDFLKSEKQVNLEYVYDGMKVGKFATEEEFVTKRVAEYNEKTPGRGDKWRESWVDDRAGKYQPKFYELLNKQLSDRSKELQFGTFKDAKYTLILKTTFTEPGWNAAVMRRPAFINADACFVETQNRSNVVAVVTITKSPGSDVWGFDYDTGQRLQESYAKAGKELGVFIAKKVK